MRPRRVGSSIGLLLVTVLVSLFGAPVAGNRAEDMMKELVGEMEDTSMYHHPYMEVMYIGGPYFVAHASPGNSFGVFVTQQTKYGKIVFDGGNGLEMTATLVKEALASGLDPTVLEQLDSYSIFALVLMLEEGDRESAFLTQLEILTTMAHLPLDTSPFLSPLMWSGEDLALLYPSFVVERVQLQQRHILRTFEFLEEHLFSRDPVRFHPDRFTPRKWLSRYCSARAMSFMHPRLFELSLVPFISTFRHSTADAAAFDWDDLGTRVATNRKYDMGEEMKLNYWDIHRAHLFPLLEHGFIDAETMAKFKREFLEPSNLLLSFGHIPDVQGSAPYTKVSFRIALPFDDLVVEHFLLPYLLRIPQVDPESMTAVVAVESDGLPTELMQLSRLLSLRFVEITSYTLDRLSHGAWISLENELRATRRVIAVLEMQLGRYIDSAEIILEQLAHYEEYSPRKQPIAAMSLLAVEQLCLRRAVENMQAHWNNILLSPV